MSITPHFSTRGGLPGCLPDPANLSSGYWNRSKIRNLSLAQVINFYWNVKNVVFATAGSLTTTFDGHTGTANANGSLTLSPLGVTGDWTVWDTFYSGSGGPGVYSDNGWYRTSNTAGLTPGQSTNEPIRRVCNVLANSPYSGLRALNINCVSSLGSQYNSADIEFSIEPDALHPGQYAIAYYLGISFPASPFPYGTNLYFRSDVFTGNDLLASGTFTIAGITFPWYAGYGYASNVPASHDPCSLVVTHEMFTYPP